MQIISYWSEFLTNPANDLKLDLKFRTEIEKLVKKFSVNTYRKNNVQNKRIKKLMIILVYNSKLELYQNFIRTVY